MWIAVAGLAIIMSVGFLFAMVVGFVLKLLLNVPPVSTSRVLAAVLLGLGIVVALYATAAIGDPGTRESLVDIGWMVGWLSLPFWAATLAWRLWPSSGAITDGGTGFSAAKK